MTHDALGMLRVARTAIRELHEKIGILDSLVGLMESIAGDVYPGDEGDELRAATTILRSALREVVSSAVDASVAVGQIRLVGAMRGIEIEQGPEES